MKALVTGATGFLGQHLCRRLVNEGYEVTILCRSTSDTGELDNLNLTKIIGDISDTEAVSRAVTGNEIVFHLAADISYWKHQKKSQDETNIQGTKNIIKSCLEKSVQRLVHVSSVVTVGIPKNSECPANEDFVFNLENIPLNYHISKRRAEEIVLGGVKKGLDALIVNPGFIWGRDGKKFRGAEFIQKVLQSRKATYFTGGICVVHVEDVINGMIAAVKHGRSGERYILGGENLTFKRITESIVHKKNLRRIFVAIPPAATWLSALVLESVARFTHRRPRITFGTHYGASRFYYYDSSKAKKELGYSFRDFSTILDECFSFLESRQY